MRINSDNSHAEELLKRLEGLLLDGGGWIHPNLTFICKSNNISINLKGSQGDNPFILKIPQNLLVPAKPLNLSVKDEQFFIEPDSGQLSERQIDIAETMIALYNVTNKVEFHKLHSPWVSFMEAPELFDRLLDGRTLNQYLSNKSDFFHGVSEEMSYENYFCNDFIDTRVTSHKGNNDVSAQYKFLPLIDYLDHDCRASGFMMIESKSFGYTGHESDNDFFLCIKNFQPFLNHARSDCFVSYGFFDALDTFLQYGFIDELVPFVRSVPLNIPVRDCPDLVVKAFPSTDVEPVIPDQFKDIKPYWPGVVQLEDGKIGLSQLVIGLGGAPNALRRVLISVMRTLVGDEASRAFLVERTLDVERFVYNRNVDFYEDLIHSLKSDETYPLHLKKVVYHLATVQLQKLKAYAFNDAYFDNYINEALY